MEVLVGFLIMGSVIILVSVGLVMLLGYGL